MRKMTRMLTLLVAVLCLLSHLLTVPLTAAEASQGGQPRKVVSVLYDNSKSMKMSSTAAEDRYEYARYAMQVLMALMGPQDKLVVNPMNDPVALAGVEIKDRSHRVEVVLTEDERARDDELRRVMNEPLFKELPKGGTPGDALRFAVEELTLEGMQRKDEIKGVDVSDTQYWLVILTDGPFEGDDSTAKIIERYTEPYASLQTIYLAFGKEFEDPYVKPQLDALDQMDDSKNTFTHYIAPDSSKVIETMEKVANQMTGRYTLADQKFDYDTNGNKAIIDLERVGQTLSSISVIGQDCNVKLLDATLDGKKLKITQNCVLDPDDELDMDPGFSAVIQLGEPKSEGIVELIFSGPVPDLVVLVEPSLRIEAYMEYLDKSGAWIEADEATLCGACLPGDTVRMGYRVYDLATGKEVGLHTMFDLPIDTEVTYDKVKCEVGDAFALVEGNNEAVVTVSMNNGGYRLHDPFMCIIYADHDDYRVDAQGPDLLQRGDGAATIAFSVHDKSVKESGYLNKAQMGDYEWSVRAFYDKTKEEIPVSGSLQDDGSVEVSFLPRDERLYGNYVIEMTAISKYGIPATGQYTLAYGPTSLVVSVVSGDGMTFSQHQLKLQDDPVANGRPDYKKRSIVFEVVAGEDEKVPLDGSLVNYMLTVAGEDITERALNAGHITVSGNQLTYTPTESDLGSAALSLGTKDVALTVVSRDISSLRHTATAKIDVSDTAYDVIVVEEDGVKVDRFDLVGSNAVLHFRVLRDGSPIAEEDIRAAFAAGDAVVSSKTFKKNDLLPCGMEHEVVPLHNGEWGIEVRVTQDGVRPFRWFGEMLIAPFGGERTIEVTYQTSDPEVGRVSFVSQQFLTYIFRIIVLAIVLFAFIYLALWLVGFYPKLSRRLPRGTIVQVKMVPGANATVDTVDVNDTFAAYWLWHARRLIPKKPRGWDDAKEWYGIGLFGSQPSVSSPSQNLELAYYDQGKRRNRRPKLRFIVNRDDMVLYSRSEDGEEAEALRRYISVLKSDNYANASLGRIDADDLKDVFEEKDGNPYVGNGAVVSIGDCCGCINSSGVMTVEFFVQRR